MSGRFVKVKCPKCNNEQNIFSKPATVVKCLVCEDVLAKNTGGECSVSATVIQILE